MSTRVLVPYDQSEQADYALAHATGRFESATIVLLNVVEPFTDHTGAAGYEPSRYPQQLETAEEMLENVRDQSDAADRIETVVRYGRPAHTVLRYIDDNSIDEIVMGSHGRDGATRLLLGSVAETVARRSPVPVTVVRTEPATDALDNILVPFEGSIHARNALTYALDQFESADITALYVTYPPTESIRDAGSGFEILEDWDEEREDHAESVLGIAEEVAGDHGRAIRTESIAGEPAETIVGFAEANAVDHIVIGSAGRGGISRLLLGSVAETVTRRAPVSVTIAK